MLEFGPSVLLGAGETFAVTVYALEDVVKANRIGGEELRVDPHADVRGAPSEPNERIRRGTIRQSSATCGAPKSLPAYAISAIRNRLPIFSPERPTWTTANGPSRPRG